MSQNGTNCFEKKDNEQSMSSRILVDADACPVKEEIYKVAYRTNTPVILVSNSYLRLPQHPLITQIVVSDGFDAADDHIAETATNKDVVITSDILLAERVLKSEAITLAPNGKALTQLGRST